MDDNREKIGKGNPPKHSRFKPGNQASKGKGRPKKLPALDELMAEVLSEEKDGKTAAQAILAALRAKAAKGDTKAAEILLDRAYGKAKQSIEHSGNPEAPVLFKLDDRYLND